MIDRGDGPEAETVVSLPDAPSATMLASALNGVLPHQVTADQHLSVVLDGAPDPMRTATSALLPTLTAATEEPTAVSGHRCRTRRGAARPRSRRNRGRGRL